MQHPVTTAEGQEFAKSIGAAAYMECSAMTSEGVKECFEVAVREALASKAENIRREKRSRSRFLRMVDFFSGFFYFRMGVYTWFGECVDMVFILSFDVAWE